VLFGLQVWRRPITPQLDNQEYSYAVAFVSRRTDGAPYAITFALKEVIIR